MGQITVLKDAGGIPGLWVITPALHGDSRGFFMETYNARDLREAGLDVTFVQDNQSRSVRGVLRGLHLQREHAQGKLVRVIRGEVFDAAVDLRRDSPTYSHWFGLILSARNRRQLYIPQGFAHGFLVLSAAAEFCYKTTDYYHPESETGIAWNDPDIGITWPKVTGEYPGNADPTGYSLSDGTPLLMSEKDKRWPALRDRPLAF